MTFIILAVILISLIFAILGCVVLWKKYVYFGDGLSHTSLFAGSISAIAYLPIMYSGAIVAVIFAILVFIFKNRSGNDVIINLVSSFMLSLALIINYLNPSNISLTNLLFGDILLISSIDLIILAAMLVLIVGFLYYFYNQILVIIINRDIAIIKGINVKMIELGVLILLSLSIFFTIKIVGALMVTGILLAPPMIARFISSTPLQMIIKSIIIALLINLSSLIMAFYMDMPVTPVIVITGVLSYFICYIKINVRNFYL